jgi:Transposase DDE domain group 1
MEWAENNDVDYIFGLAARGALDAIVAEVAVNLRFHHANQQGEAAHLCQLHVPGRQLETAAQRVARLECSLQPVAGSPGMRQEVDIRYVVTSLEGSARHLYENVYCQRGQMENLIKLHKAQLGLIAT